MVVGQKKCFFVNNVFEPQIGIYEYFSVGFRFLRSFELFNSLIPTFLYRRASVNKLLEETQAKTLQFLESLCDSETSLPFTMQKRRLSNWMTHAKEQILACFQGAKVTKRPIRDEKKNDQNQKEHGMVRSIGVLLLNALDSVAPINRAAHFSYGMGCLHRWPKCSWITFEHFTSLHSTIIGQFGLCLIPF